MVPAIVEQVSFVIGFLMVVTPVFGFMFRLGWRFADFFIHDLCDTYRILKEMFLSFISWLKKKVSL